jgi:hypothetical protein
MTEFQIAVPTRLDYAVSDESTLPHAGWSRYAALALGGDYPCLAAHSWSTDATDLAVFGEEAVTTARTDEGASALLALEDGWAYRGVLEHEQTPAVVVAVLVDEDFEHVLRF